uniref:NADH:quinone oxidoreductase/Mrp antiporter membrane subunit domain-containing protein n=1 Tax=Solanum lycopersicum TaxID=4081 RepID=A0A3Q7FAC1_SOLLC
MHQSLKWWSFEVLILLSGLLPNPKLETSVLSTWYVCMQHFMITYFMLNSSFVYSTDPHILFISLMISSLYFFIPFGLVVVARLVQYSYNGLLVGSAIQGTSFSLILGFTDYL